MTPQGQQLWRQYAPQPIGVTPPTWIFETQRPRKLTSPQSCALPGSSESNRKLKIMTITTSVHNDQDIQSAVQDELHWTPDVDSAGIGVAVEDGTVSLSGEVESYLERVSAKRAALRVHGVRAVVDDIVVHPVRNTSRVTETDLAKTVQKALDWSGNVPAAVQATIVGRNVTLTGEVVWNYQRESARTAIEDLDGVDYIDNFVTLRARPAVKDAEKEIRAALERNAGIDSGHVRVQVEGTQATLTGTVRSWSQLRAAETAVWSSPHITHIQNDLHIEAI